MRLLERHFSSIATIAARLLLQTRAIGQRLKALSDSESLNFGFAQGSLHALSRIGDPT
jgi:hypothetical protein